MIRVRDKGLGPRLGFDPKRPSAEADFWVEGIAPGQNENDILVAVYDYAPKQIIFRIPNAESLTPATLFTRIYQTGCQKIEFKSPTIAEVTLLWGQTDAAPAPSAGGQNPDGSEGSEGEGPDPDEVLGPEYRYNTQGGTRHITRSIRTSSAILTDGTPAPNVKRIIGLSRDRVEGCDVISGDLSWSVTMRQCQATTRYWRRLSALTGTVNKERFCGREGGEILFTGASGDYKEGDGWTITWNFLERQNETKFYIDTVSGAFTEKKGHDYVWYVYADTELEGFSIQTPTAMYVEQVYKWDEEATYIINGVEEEAGPMRGLFAV